EPLTAFSKIVAFEVRPVRPSSRSRASSPELISWRRMLSSHSDWPSCLSSLIADSLRAVLVAMALLAFEELGGGGSDVLGGDPRSVHQLLGLARSRQLSHRQVG